MRTPGLKIALLSPLLFGLGACASAVPPITFATPAEIGTGMQPASYATTYYARNFRACVDYFNGLVSKQNQAGRVGMLGGAAGAAAAAAGGPIGLAGGIAAATALGSGLLNSDATSPIGGELPVPVYSLWYRGNMAYLAAAPTPTDQPTAQFLGDVNAAMCTPVGLQAAEAAALMSAPVVVVPTVPTSPVVVPPPIIVPPPSRPPVVVPPPPVVVPPPPPVVVVPPPVPPSDPNGPIVTPTPEVAHVTVRHRRTRAQQPTQEELQYRAIQQYGRNAVEGGQRILPPYVCVGSGCVTR